MFSETTTSPHYSKGRGIAMYRISFFQRALNLCWDMRGPMKIEKFHNYKEKIWAMTAPEEKGSKMDFFMKEAWISLCVKAGINKYKKSQLTVYLT